MEIAAQSVVYNEFYWYSNRGGVKIKSYNHNDRNARPNHFHF